MYMSALLSISLVHFLNDSMQAVIPAIFPFLHYNLNLSFTQLGILAFANNMTASIIQPFIGSYTDKNPLLYLLPSGMLFTMLGMFLLSISSQLIFLVFAVTFVGIGSAIFHPESSRIVVTASNSRIGSAQSIFQVGGNAGQAIAPLLTILLFEPYGQKGAIWFTIVALIACIILYKLTLWQRNFQRNKPKPKVLSTLDLKSKNPKLSFYIFIILLITTARTWYVASITNFFAIYQMEIFSKSLTVAQIYVFVFMIFAALGTLSGGYLSEKFGQKNVLFFATFIVAPLTILLPYTSGIFMCVLLAASGYLLLATFAVSLSYTMELMPGQVGKVAGMIFGFAFGFGAIGSLLLGKMSDVIGISSTMIMASFIPCIALFAFLLPQEKEVRRMYKE